MTDIDTMFANLHTRGWMSDPNALLQEDSGGGGAQSSGWYGGHGYSSAIGQVNLVVDAAMDTIGNETFGATEAQVSRDLYVARTLTSGSAPTTNTISQITRVNTTENSFNSGIASVRFTTSAACDITDTIYTKEEYTVGANTVDMPWLVTAVKLFRNATPWTSTGVTTLTATLELVKNITGSEEVVATDTIDVLNDMGAASTAMLIAAAPGPWTVDDTYDYRLKWHIVKTGTSATDVQFGHAEHQIVFNYVPEPVPYVPEWYEEFLAGGDGSDGDHTVSGTETLTSDKYYKNLTVPAGATLRPAGWRIFVKDVCLINGIVECNGGNGGNGGNGSLGYVGLGGTAGAAAATSGPLQTLPGLSGTDGNSSDVNGKPGIDAVATPAPSIGPGAAGGGGGGAATGYSPGAQGASTSNPSLPYGWHLWPTLFDWAVNTGGVWSFFRPAHQAGGGGGGGGTGGHRGGGGGGSGASGGVIFIAARVIAGSGTIRANGGNGGSGGSRYGAMAGGGGGGAGGSAGTIVRIARTSFFTGTLQANPGNNGASGGTNPSTPYVNPNWNHLVVVGGGMKASGE